VVRVVADEIVNQGIDASVAVVLDLGGVDFIDSAGLGVVLGALKRVRGAGGALRVVVDEPAVRQVFALTELDRIVPLDRTVDEAVAHPVREARTHG